MSAREISLEEARALAVEQARIALRGLFPKNESDVFEEFVLSDTNFWLFFRNRKVEIPRYPNGKIGSDCAFAIGKHGMILNVKDNFDAKSTLAAQVRELSGYFARHD